MKANTDEELKDQLKENFNFDQRTIQKDGSADDEETKTAPVQEDKPKASDSGDGGFFDSISSSTLETDKDRAANREKAAKDRDMNRKKDADTFGSSMSNNF